MKTLFLLDPGHGGLYPKGHAKEGQYTTAGKRSPLFNDRKFPDGTPFCLYEGVNNRDNVNRLLEEMQRHGLEAMDIVNDWRDISLNERIRRINELARTRNCVLISIHSNGHSYSYINKEKTIRYEVGKNENGRAGKESTFFYTTGRFRVILNVWPILQRKNLNVI